jgi:prevent-host-death family protein
MTLRRSATEVGVRDLHDRLSEHLERVVAGQDVVVTRRGTALSLVEAGPRAWKAGDAGSRSRKGGSTASIDSTTAPKARRLIGPSELVGWCSQWLH